MKKFIVLLTDFGNDFYVGQMKGVIKSINPSVEIIDLCNNIEPQNILQASIVINCSYKFFPKGSIFVCVVDPEVGSKRDIIIVSIKNYTFIAPDNGILSSIIELPDSRTFKIVNNKYFLKPLSNTFHGRDIMAPIAAYISKGVKISSVAERIEKTSLNQIKIPLPEKIIKDKSIIYKGKYLFHDSFGNIVTNFTKNLLDDKDICKYAINIKIANKKWLVKFKHFYSEVKKNEILAYINSFGFVEIAINNSNAYKFFSKFGDVTKFCFELIEIL